MKSNIKYLGLGLLGGMLPLGLFIALSTTKPTAHIDTISNKTSDFVTQTSNVGFLPQSQTENFVDASEKV